MFSLSNKSHIIYHSHCKIEIQKGHLWYNHPTGNVCLTTTILICSLPILVVRGSVDRGLNELSNDLLRHDGLAKQMELNTVDEEFIQSVSDWHNHILRCSLKYCIPIEVFEIQTGYHLSEMSTE